MKTVHIVGGGISGCSLAYFLKDKYNVKLYEKNSHLGGLSKTYYSIENIPYQKGFHVLHTNQQWILNIITKLGINMQRVFYDVAINPLLDFKYYRFPFNEESVNFMPWHWKENALNDFNKINGASGLNLKEEIINFYGKTIYDIFYKNYIKKLTGFDADEIDETSWFRKYLHPINKVVSYYQEDCYFPIDFGWNDLFIKLADGVEIYNAEVDASNFSDNDLIVVTTRPDEFINSESLPYIGFDFEIDSVSYDENKPDTIIYPNDVSFLSMTQYGKLFSPYKQVEEKTIIVKEFSRFNSGEFAHPIPKKEFINQHSSILSKIREKFQHIYFCGPLATYSHMSMAESIDMAHKVAGEIKHNERSL